MRVVLVRLSALGDIVHTWPLAVALKEIDRTIHLTWIVEEPLRSLVEGHPAVDAILSTATSRWRKRPFSAASRAEIAQLKTRIHELSPDLALDPQGTVKSAIVTRWTKAEKRVGLSRPWRRELIAGIAYTKTLNGAPGGRHVVETNVSMAKAVSEINPSGFQPDGSWLAERVANRIPSGPWSADFAVVLPGAGGRHKLLPPQTLSAVCDGLVGDGLEVVVLWGPGERERASEVAGASGPGVHLAPATDIEEMAALLSQARLVIGGDTGPVHLAASFGVATIGVFLASDCKRNGPLGRRTAVVSGAAELPQRPSGTARTRPVRSIDEHEILAAARSIL